MPQLLEARSLEEDWTGLKDSKARRKLQNRLNVRAHRRRKQIGQKQNGKDTTAVVPLVDDSQHRPVNILGRYGSATWQVKSKYLGSPDYQIMKSPLVRQFIEATYFPLSGDNLIPLLQFNILRGILTNLSILGLMHTVPDECHNVSVLAPLFPVPNVCPETLKPTAMQKLILHEPWIDTLPDPEMRDNALRLMNEIDQVELMLDLVGRVCQGQNTAEDASILVWNDPWCPEGWEMTPGFAMKWGQLVKGCSRLLESTNRHRARRGEVPLVIEL